MAVLQQEEDGRGYPQGVEQLEVARSFVEGVQHNGVLAPCFFIHETLTINIFHVSLICPLSWRNVGPNGSGPLAKGIHHVALPHDVLSHHSQRTHCAYRHH